MPPVRRLTAILAADVAGYSRLMGAGEEGTHEPTSQNGLPADASNSTPSGQCGSGECSARRPSLNQVVIQTRSLPGAGGQTSTPRLLRTVSERWQRIGLKMPLIKSMRYPRSRGWRPSRIAWVISGAK
jgi:hypothetical protein